MSFIDQLNLKNIFIICGLIIAWFGINKITKKSKKQKAEK